MAVNPPSALTIVQVRVAVNVTRSPAVSMVPAAGVIESMVMKSVVGPAGVSAPHAVKTVRQATKLSVLTILTSTRRVYPWNDLLSLDIRLGFAHQSGNPSVC